MNPIIRVIVTEINCYDLDDCTTANGGGVA